MTLATPTRDRAPFRSIALALLALGGVPGGAYASPLADAVADLHMAIGEGEPDEGDGPPAPYAVSSDHGCQPISDFWGIPASERLHEQGGETPPGPGAAQTCEAECDARVEKAGDPPRPGYDRVGFCVPSGPGARLLGLARSPAQSRALEKVLEDGEQQCYSALVPPTRKGVSRAEAGATGEERRKARAERRAGVRGRYLKSFSFAGAELLGLGVGKAALSTSVLRSETAFRRPGTSELIISILAAAADPVRTKTQELLLRSMRGKGKLADQDRATLDSMTSKWSPPDRDLMKELLEIWRKANSARLDSVEDCPDCEIAKAISSGPSALNGLAENADELACKQGVRRADFVAFSGRTGSLVLFGKDAETRRKLLCSNGGVPVLTHADKCLPPGAISRTVRVGNLPANCRFTHTIANAASACECVVGASKSVDCKLVALSGRARSYTGGSGGLSKSRGAIGERNPGGAVPAGDSISEKKNEPVGAVPGGAAPVGGGAVKVEQNR